VMVVVAAVSAAIASPIDDCYASNDHIVQGDKCFYNLTFGGDFEAGNVIGVTPDTNPQGLHGFFLVLDVSQIGPGTWDGTVEYDVAVLDPNYHISDIHLGIYGEVEGGFISVTETAYDGVNAVGQADVCISDLVPCSPTANVDLDYLVDSVHIRKDILIAVQELGEAHLTGMTQYISQVPELASVFLTGMGLLGLAALRRNRNSPL